MKQVMNVTKERFKLSVERWSKAMANSSETGEFRPFAIMVDDRWAEITFENGDLLVLRVADFTDWGAKT